MIKIVNGVEIEMTQDEIDEWEAGQASYVPPESAPLARLYKSTLIRRMSPAEAAHFEGVLLAEEAWVRMLYNSVEYFEMSDALVGYMHMVIAAEAGEERADELLTPEV